MELEKMDQTPYPYQQDIKTSRNYKIIKIND